MTDPNVELVNGTGDASAIDLAEPTTQVGTRPPTGEVGSGYDPDKIFTRFDDGRYYSTRDLWPRDFEEMLQQDGKARTLEAVLTLPLMSADTRIEPGDGDTGEAEWLREQLYRPANAGGMTTPLDQVIGQMTSAVTKRRAYFEKVFKIDGSRVTFDKIAFRPQSSCYLLRDKGNFAFRGFKQKTLDPTGATSDVTIPVQKAFVYIHGQWRDPLYGVSRLDTAFNLYQSKQKIRFLWSQFLENQVIQKAIAKHSSPDIPKQREFAERVASLKGGGVVGIGPDQDVIPFGGNAVGGEFKLAMDYLSAEMSGSVLAGFTDLAGAAASGRGSFALSSDQTDFYLMSLEATLGEMGTALTNWVLADLIRWNFGVNAVVPTFTFTAPQAEAVDSAFSLLQALATVPSPGVPQEFIDLLAEKVSALLGIDTDKVRKAIEERQRHGDPNNPADQLRTGIDAATQLVSQGLGIGDTTAPAPDTTPPVQLAEERPEVALAHPAPVTVESPVTVEQPNIDVHVHTHRGEVEIVRDGEGNITGARPKDD